MDTMVFKEPTFTASQNRSQPVANRGPGLPRRAPLNYWLNKKKEHGNGNPRTPCGRYETVTAAEN